MRQPVDVILEGLAIVGILLVENDQIDAQATPPPIGVGLEQLLEGLTVTFTGHAQQEHGIVTRDAIGPKRGLAARVGGQSCRISPAATVGVDE